MNSLITSEFPLTEAQIQRYDLMQVLTDDDLAYKLPGDNVTLGELCLEMCEIEYCYVQSFKTLKMDWSYHRDDPNLAYSVDRLTAWFLELDAAFEAVIRPLSEEELHSTTIDRGNGFTPSLFVQFEIYREALMMFYAKASIYLKALQKTVNEAWRIAIG